MKIHHATCRFINRPLVRTFGFKGGSANYVRAVEVEIHAEGMKAIGESTQGALWSDSVLHERLGEGATNETMYDVTKHVCNSLEGMEFDTPEGVFDHLYDEAARHAQYILAYNPRKAFILNALVPVDNALRMLYAKKKNDLTFETFASVKGLTDIKEERLGLIPLINYNTSEHEIRRLADEGVFNFKIKIGANPDNDNNRDKMVEADKERVEEIHNILKDYKTPYTQNGKLAYFLDANGRYDSKYRLRELLNFTKSINAFEHIALLEEPFDETNTLTVDTFGVSVAADESLHDEKDALRKIELGYSVFVVKPIARTITVTNKIVKLALENNIRMFCGDLTVTPMLVEINKNYAARLPKLKGINTGIVESNGPQNLVDWKDMMQEHPLKDSNFTKVTDGVFELDQEFYETAGGIFLRY